MRVVLDLVNAFNGDDLQPLGGMAEHMDDLRPSHTKNVSPSHTGEPSKENRAIEYVEQESSI
jgi:hypothetical protein